jgi:hypothetical protein
MLSRASIAASTTRPRSSEGIDQLAFCDCAQASPRTQHITTHDQINGAPEYLDQFTLYAANIEGAEERLAAGRTLIEIDHHVDVALRRRGIVRDRAGQDRWVCRTMGNQTT